MGLGGKPTPDLNECRFLPQGPIYRFLRHVFVDRLTDSGRVMFWAGVLAMGAGQGTLVIQIYLVFCAIAAMFIVSIAMARLARVRLKIHADVPDRTTAGATLKLPIQVSNPERRTAVDVILRDYSLPRDIRAVDEAGTAVPPLAGGDATLITRSLEFTRRGHFVLHGIRQETVFPWGIWRDLVVHAEEHGVLVYPRFHPLIALDIPAGRRYQPGGIALSSSLGDSIEFVGTREFRDGDPVRAIHWRTWARLGKPAVKEFQEEYFCRVALLLDTFLPAKPTKAEREAFEAAISLSAAIADCLSREEYVIDIFAAGPEIYYLQSGRSLAYLENVLDILACLEPCHEPPFEKVAPVLAENLASVTTTIVVLLDWDAHRDEMVRVIRDYGSAVKVILVRDGAPTHDFAGAASLGAAPLTHLRVSDVAGVESL